MTQNRISLAFPAADLASIEGSIANLEDKFDRLIELTPEERRGLIKMGDKSEAFVRQTLMILAQNPQILPPDFDLEEALRDLAALDALRPFLARLERLFGKCSDTDMTLGSDLMSAALEGYGYARMAGKGAAVESLREAMAYRLRRRPKPDDKPAA